MTQQPKVSDELENIAFKIYVYMLKNNPNPTRLVDIQRHFNLKSIQLAHYYVKKLVKLRLVEQTKKSEAPGSYADYKAKEFVSVSTLKPYLYIANRFLIPRQLIYMMIFVFIICLSWLSPLPYIAQLAGLIGIIICAYELFKQKL